MKGIMFVFILLCLNVKFFVNKCACISIKTKYSDTISILNNKVNIPTELSSKHNHKTLGIIYEDIEYASINNK